MTWAAGVDYLDSSVDWWGAGLLLLLLLLLLCFFLQVVGLLLGMAGSS